MAKTTNQFNPDYAVPPGWILEEHIATRGMRLDEFAGLCDLPVDALSEIIAGKAPIGPSTAYLLGRETGLDETVWLNIESAYRDKLKEFSQDRLLAEWATQFPAKELVRRGHVSESSLQADRMAAMLSFFDVWSADTLADKYGEASVAYRHSPSFQNNPQVLATWLRLGEIEAQGAECAAYDREAFLGSLAGVRALTGSTEGQIFERSQELCRQSGVALCFIKPFKGAAVSGASYWLPSGRPVIQLSSGHKTDDHLWFSLFHEAAHILLHSKKRVFIDAIRGEAGSDGEGASETESQADKWAQNFLVPRSDWQEFAGEFLGSADDVRRFASEQGIAPGIVVGRLQREGRLPWNRLNGLKRKLEWAESSA